METTLKVTSCKNIRFKGQFVLDNLEKLRKIYSFKSGSLKLIAIARRDGLKCDICQTSVEFRIHKEFGMIMYTPDGQRMTMDHDLLNSLDGHNGVDNQHLLCYKCNQLRGNRFAEYKEFKEWYLETTKNNSNPFAEINKVKRNFSYIDFTKNGFQKNQLLKIVSMGAANEMPQRFKDELTSHFFKHGAFRIDVKEKLYYERLLRYTNTAWDDYINDLLVLICKQRINLDIEKSNKQYGLLRKKASTSVDGLVNRLNNIIKTEYQHIRLPIDEEKNKIKLQKKLQNQKPENKFIAFWQKISYSFTQLFA